MSDDKQPRSDGSPQWRSCPCPICKKMSDRKYHPFCSRRCADIDLARWLGGRYAIPARSEPDEDDEWPAPGSQSDSQSQ